MSIENTVDISQVPPDIDPMEIGEIVNPLKEDFTHAFDGKDYTIPAGESKQYTLSLCVHLAKHLAEKIIRDEQRGKILKIKDEKLRNEEMRKAIPDYRGRIWEKMKTLVKTDSDFFNDGKEGDKNSNKEKFIR